MDKLKTCLFWDTESGFGHLRGRALGFELLLTALTLKPPNSKLLVAEWIHFTLFGIISPTVRTKSIHFLGLMNSATKNFTPKPYVRREAFCIP